ncbi:MAG: MucR family transcriptional regulator [Alphaproteobacteria bacterium]|nr:MucR family transcriptional regulator [Alphaproteobacteria bacterium]
MSSEKSGNLSNGETLKMTADVVSAYVGNNVVPSGQLAGVIGAVHTTLLNLDKNGSGGQQTPAVSIRKSVTPGFIICLEDGKKLKMLKRHLRTTYGMTPDEYRTKWGLPVDYPMVAPNYAKQRSEFAKKIGLGLGSRGRKKKA